MNFAELRFWGYLALGLLVVLTFRPLAPAGPKRGLYDRIGLLLLGLSLLMAVGLKTFLIYLTVSVGSYVGLIWVLRFDPDRRRRYLFIFIPLQLLPLFYYKYAHFVTADVLGLDPGLFHELVIPVGISFYTFQKVAFVLDTLASNHPLPRLLDYMNFAGFFPQIVAGPIERRQDLLPQMERFRFAWSADNINQGASWIVVGLFFKLCLADNLAKYFDASSTTNAFSIWFTNLLFGLRIYYDFAGYSLVALGLARALGIRLTLNFASPYCSTSITEFWRRWHVTLSQWFRDYLYIPLGGGRTPRWPLNLAIVFIVSGVWHGAGWNFVLWGALHGSFLIASRLAPDRLRLPKTAAWILTMAGCALAWLCFYETQTPALLAKWNTLLTPTAYSPEAFRQMLNSWGRGDLIVLGGFLLLSGTTLVFEWLSLFRHQEPYVLLRRSWVLVCLVVLTVLLADPGKNNAFIYFAF